METTIRKIGNSSGIILPKPLIEKYNLKKVIIEDHGDGILIKPAQTSLFAEKLALARKNKKAIYKNMEDQSSSFEVQEYYKDQLSQFESRRINRYSNCLDEGPKPIIKH